VERTISEMTLSELRRLIGEVVEEKLTELGVDSDAGLELRPDLRRRLERDLQRVAGGERGERLEDVVDRLGLA